MTTPTPPIRWRDRQPAGVQDLKDQARRLRELLASTASPVSSAQALEMMARVHGYDSWGQLNAELQRAEAEPASAGPGHTLLEGPIVGISQVEAGMRLHHYAKQLGFSEKMADDVMVLARQCLSELNSGWTYCDTHVGALLMEAEARGGVSPQARRAVQAMRKILGAVDLRELPPLRHRLQVTPGPDHAEPGPEWQQISELPDDIFRQRPHMAVIARNDIAASAVIRHFWQRGKLVTEVPNNHRPSEQLVEALERHFGECGLARPEDARDFVRTVIRSVFEDPAAPKPVPAERLILSIPWRPHETGYSLFLATARSWKIDVIVRITPARYTGTAARELKAVLANCGTLVLGPDTVMPDFVPGPVVANRGADPIHRPNVGQG